jgi:2-phosphosulfolactate phosphatase
MKVMFYATLEQAEKDAFQGAAVVVIDVLRASSTIIAALENGAEKIIPTGDVATAARLVRPGERDVKLLAGERKACPVPGFDLCNSPSEFTPDAIRGKTIVFTTTNGTRAITAAAKGSRVLVGALRNVRAVAAAVEAEGELVVLCCGSEGSIAAEDLLCAGLLIRHLGSRVDAASMNDGARLAVLLAERFADDVEGFVRSCDHARRLVSLGYEGDVAFCSRVDASDRVPEVRDGAITA